MLVRLLVAVTSAAVVLGLCGAGAAQSSPGRARLPLFSGTVAVGEGGMLAEVPDGWTSLIPGTRVIAGTKDSSRYAAEQRRWLAAGTVPQIAELGHSSTMVRDALLDLHVLSRPYGVAVAGWTAQWRYVWPRDSALVATALARTGHSADAERLITFLEGVQPESGIFAARYRPDGSGVPDPRGPQTDGLGWALWAMHQVAEELSGDARTSFVERHRVLLDTSTDGVLRLIDNRRSLPPASADYWETPERSLTLSTAALLHAGLTSAARLYAIVDQQELSAKAGDGAARLGAAIAKRFAAAGYPRTAGAPASTVDLGVSFLLPPFTGGSAGHVDRGVQDAWRRSASAMARPAGGLAPGGSWRDDGVSWTTATGSSAMTAAFVGDRDSAVSRLRWLDDHRTRLGSLPEKVLYNGQPASVAPLAWAAAAVIIAVDELAQQQR